MSSEPALGWPRLCLRCLIYGTKARPADSALARLGVRSSPHSWAAPQRPHGGRCAHPSAACDSSEPGSVETPQGAPPERKARGGASRGRELWGGPRPRGLRVTRRQPQGSHLRRPRGGPGGLGGWAEEGGGLTCRSRLRGPGLGPPGPLRARLPRPRPRHASGPGARDLRPRFREPPEARGSETRRGDSAAPALRTLTAHPGVRRRTGANEAPWVGSRGNGSAPPGPV